MTDANVENGANHEPETERRNRQESLGMAGMDLYAVLNIETSATDDDIKRAYRRMALRFHPDKNPGDDVAAEKFKEINYANSVLSNKTKRQIYDTYGSAGLKMSEAVGEENLGAFLLAKNPWFRCCLCTLFCFTGCCCCFCCCCCFNFCCGKFKPKPEEMDEEYYAWMEEQQGGASPSAQQSGAAAGGSPPVMTQPTSQASASPQAQGGAADRPTVIAMPYPAPPTYEDTMAADAVVDREASQKADESVVVTSQPTSLDASGDHNPNTPSGQSSPSETSPLTKSRAGSQQQSPVVVAGSDRDYGSTSDHSQDKAV